MEEKIQLRDGVELYQSLATRKWDIGVMISTVTMADGKGYALIRTDYGEYDLVPFYHIIQRQA